MSRILLLALFVVAATASPASALNMTYDLVVATPWSTCGANMTATWCAADVDGPSSQNSMSCSVVNGQIVCHQTAAHGQFP